jgi:hypothetical protein
MRTVLLVPESGFVTSVGGLGMAGQARIVLYSWGRAVGARHHEPAADRLSTLTGPPPPARGWAESRKVGAGLVGWRVLGANNRELGRGAGPFWRTDEAYKAVHDAQMVIDAMVTRFWADDLGEWFWNISLDDERLAVSSRGYRRQRECIYSLEQFREHFPTARVVLSHVLRPASMNSGSLALPAVLVASPSGFAVAGPHDEVTA